MSVAPILNSFGALVPGFTYFIQVLLPKIALSPTNHFLKRAVQRGFNFTSLPKIYSMMAQVKVGVCLEVFDGVTTIVVARVKPNLVLLITGWRGQRKKAISSKRLSLIMQMAMNSYENKAERKSYLTQYAPKEILVDLIRCSDSEIENISKSGKRVCEGLIFFKTNVDSFLNLFRSKHPSVKTCGVLHGPVLRLLPEHESNPCAYPIAVIPDPIEMKDKGLVQLNRWNTYVPNVA